MNATVRNKANKPTAPGQFIIIFIPLLGLILLN